MEYNQPSEIVKDVNFGDFAKEKVIAGVEKLAKAVKSTSRFYFRELIFFYVCL